MSYKSLYDSSMFTALREGRVGVQCERSLRSLLLLLDGWKNYTGPRKELYLKKDDGVLTAIYFDKFAMLTFRLWDTMFSNTSEDQPERREEEHSITFPSPFEPIPGKHGPGPGRHGAQKAEKPTYLLDMLYALQSEGFLNYFEVSPPQNDPDNYKSHKTTVTPALPVTDEEEFLRGFTKFEREILLDLRSAIKRLGPAEIRALGTHATHEGTVEDIEREFTYLGKKKGKLNENLRENRPFKREAQELLEFADEAWRKSQGNRDDYRSGYRKMALEINNPTLKQAFETSQATAEEVWRHSGEFDDLVKRSEQALLFTTYLHAVAVCQEHRLGQSGNAKQIKKAEDQVATKAGELNRVGVAVLPSMTNDIFVGATSEIGTTTRSRLIEVINTV